MTTKAGIGFSQKVNSREAGIEATQTAIAGAGVERCDLVILFAGGKHDPVLLREGVRSIVGVPGCLVAESLGLLRVKNWGVRQQQ